MNRLAQGLVLSVVLMVLTSTVVSVGRDVWSDVVLYALLPLNLAVVGALVVVRTGGNSVGWLFLALAVYVSASELIQGYGLLAVDRGWSDGKVGAWLDTWVWVGEMATWALVVAVFPDGRLAGRRWRWIPWCALVGGSLAGFGMAFGSYANPEFAPGVNPFLIDHPLVQVAFLSGMVLLVTSLVGAAVSLVVRMRRARGVEQQQLKWFAFSGCVVAVVAPFVVAFWTTSPWMAVIIAVAVNGIPVAAGIAILRYRLYDVDVVIKRTVVYSVLTLALVAAYAVLVLLFQVLLRPLAGESDLVVAVSTLGVAALFRPLRSAIQSVVDRRFFRSRYDVGQTLDAFADRLRHELDLDSLGSDLRAVVDETMQPESVTLWLRQERTS